MILRDLQQYIAHKRVVSLDELARQFARQPEVISGMLKHWERKGTIRKLAPLSAMTANQSNQSCASPCQQCRGCDRGKQVFYQGLQ